MSWMVEEDIEEKLGGQRREEGMEKGKEERGKDGDMEGGVGIEEDREGGNFLLLIHL